MALQSCGATRGGQRGGHVGLPSGRSNKAPRDAPRNALQLPYRYQPGARTRLNDSDKPHFIPVPMSDVSGSRPL